MTCGVYEIVNTVNGKRYVGSSVNIHKRWLTHIRELRKGTHHAQHLQRSFDKYGEECFQVRTILVCDSVDLIENEQIELDKGYDYNSSPTAQSTLGLKFSDEARERVRQNRIDRYAADPEGYSAIMSSISKGKPKSDEWKRKMSERLTGGKLSESHVENMAKARSVISDKEVKEIVEMRLEGKSLNEIANLSGVSFGQAQRICSGARYAWVTKDIEGFNEIDSKIIRSSLTKMPSNHTIHNFIHKVHGERNCTQWELRNEFPEILHSKLSNICSGVRNSHSGWSIKKAPEGA